MTNDHGASCGLKVPEILVPQGTGDTGTSRYRRYWCLKVPEILVPQGTEDTGASRYRRYWCLKVPEILVPQGTGDTGASRAAKRAHGANIELTLKHSDNTIKY